MNTQPVQRASSLSRRLTLSGHTTVPPAALRVWLVIDRWCRTHPYPPTARDVMRELGFSSTNAIIPHLRQLRAAGLIQPNDGKARALVPTCWLEVLNG